MSFVEAVRELAGRAGETMPRPENRSAADDAAARRWGMLESTLRQAHSIYRYGLTKAEAAATYLQSRGITTETIERFELGFVGTGIGRILEQRVRAHAAIVDAGIMRDTERGPVEVLRNRVVWPLKSERGALIGFAGRALPDAPQGTPKYINSPETELFKKSRELYGLFHARSAIARTRSVIVVEGYFDVWSLHQVGEDRAVANMGTQLSPDHARRLLRDADDVLLWYDGDAAGSRAILSAAKVLLSEIKDGQIIRVLAANDGRDPHDIATMGRAAVDDALSLARPFSDYLVSELTALVDSDTPETVSPVAVRAMDWVSACGPHAVFYRRSLSAALERRLGISLAPESVA